MIILNFIREHDFMGTVALFENKLIKNIENTIECLVSALKRSSEAPHYFMQYLAYSLSRLKKFYGLPNLNLQLLCIIQMKSRCHLKKLSLSLINIFNI